MLLLSLFKPLFVLASTDIRLFLWVVLVHSPVDDTHLSRYPQRVTDRPRWVEGIGRSLLSSTPDVYILARCELDTHLEGHVQGELPNKMRRLPRRIRPVHRIPAHVGVEVEIILIPDRVGLQEPPEPRVVDPRLVIVQPKLVDPRLPGVAVAPEVARRGHPVGVVAVDAHDRPRRVRDRHHRALVVGVQVAAAARADARTLVPHHRLVHPGAVDVAAQDRPGSVRGQGAVRVMGQRRGPVA